MKKCFIFFSSFVEKIPQLLFQNLVIIFLRIFFLVLHIFVGQKIMILGNRPDFLTFLAKKLPNVYVVVCKKGPPIWLSTRMSIVQGC